MSNIFDDTLNFGFGLFAYSKEKIEEAVERMVDKGSIAKKDAAGFVAELTKKGEAEREELKNMIDARIKAAADNFNHNVKPMTEEDVRRVIREELTAMKQDSEKE